MSQAALGKRFAARVVVEIIVASIGVALVVCAVSADQRWLDTHFLPGFFVGRQLYVFVESAIRVGMATFGASLAVLARGRLARIIAHNPAAAVHVTVAVVLAVVASELVLRQVRVRASEEQPTTKEPRRHLDPRLGWTIVPGRAGHHIKGGRDIVYAFDSAGYRVRSVEEPVDPERPTIVFTGESIMLGEGLTWDETVPAQTGAMLGVQSANLSVSGFATDQAYLRLQAELPRFRQPLAIVSLFTPALFDRNLDDDRPHLGPGLVWRPAERRWRLVALARRLVRYRSLETIERGIVSTREILRATVDLARSRGAASLIVVPQIEPELPVERTLRRRILDEADLPYVWVELDAGSHVPRDRHPNSRAAHLIATATATRLLKR